MSRASREARTKIACAVGALIVIKDNDLATPEVRNKLYQGIITGGILQHSYPDTGDPIRNDKWGIKVIRSLDEDIDSLGIYTFKTLVWFSHLLIIDLIELTSNPDVLKLIEPFSKIIEEISQDVLEGHVDVFYDKASALVNKLYQQFGVFESEY